MSFIEWAIAWKGLLVGDTVSLDNVSLDIVGFNEAYRLVEVCEKDTEKPV